MRATLRAAADRLRAGSFWSVLILSTLAVLVVAAVVGRSAVERAEEWRSRAAAARSTQETLDRWERRLVPADSAELAAWQASERAVRERGIATGDRLALLQLVAERAERLGIGDATIGFIAADTLSGGPARELGEEVFEQAPYALAVSFGSDYRTVARFLSGLPPQVEVVRVMLAAEEGGGLFARVVLMVFLGTGREERRAAS